MLCARNTLGRFMRAFAQTWVPETPWGVSCAHLPKRETPLGGSRVHLPKRGRLTCRPKIAAETRKYKLSAVHDMGHGQVIGKMWKSKCLQSLMLSSIYVSLSLPLICLSSSHIYVQL